MFVYFVKGYYSSRIGTVMDDILVGILPSLLGSLSQSCCLLMRSLSSSILSDLSVLTMSVILLGVPSVA